MKLISFFSIISIFFLAFRPSPLSAHGTGPPFLVIDGKYCPTNLLYVGDPIFNPGIPWDNAPDRYLVKKEISLRIDTTQLQVPEEIIARSIFRWKVEGKTFEGTEIKYTFNKVGSYLINITAKAPDSPEFVDLDSVQMDIVPTRDYQLPKAKIIRATKSASFGTPISFVSESSVDSSAKVESENWAIDNSKFENKKTISFTFDKESYTQNFVFLQVKDSNGLISYAGARLEKTEGNLKFLDMEKNGAEITEGDELAANNQSFFSSPIFYIMLASAFGVVFLFFFIRRFAK